MQTFLIIGGIVAGAFIGIAIYFICFLGNPKNYR